MERTYGYSIVRLDAQGESIEVSGLVSSDVDADSGAHLMRSAMWDSFWQLTSGEGKVGKSGKRSSGPYRLRSVRFEEAAENK